MEIDPKILLAAQIIACEGEPTDELSPEQLQEARYLAKTLYCSDCG